MYLHMFEVMVPDGAVVHVHYMNVYVPTRHVRVRHRMIEMEAASEPGDDGMPELAIADDFEWEDFALDEDD